MAIELAKAYVQIIPSTQGMMKQIAKDLGGGSGENSGGGIGKTLWGKIAGGLKTGALAGGAALGTFLTTSVFKGFGRLKDIENAQAKLAGLGHDAASVQSIMDDALKSVKGTAFGMNEAASTAAGLVAAGIKPGAELERILSLVGDSASIAGRSMQDMGLIWNSVATRGKLQGDDLMQLQSAGIPVLAKVAEQLGITQEAASKMASEGKISFTMFSDAMEDLLGGAALEMGNTVAGAWANLMAAISRFGAGLLTNVYPLIGPALKTLTSWVDDLGATVSPKLDAFANHVRDTWAYLSSGHISDAWMERIGEGDGNLGAYISKLGRIRVLWSDVTAGLAAFGAGFTIVDGEITSAGFPGFMERAGYVVHLVLDELSGGVRAFLAAFSAMDGEVTSAGFAGFMERAGYVLAVIWAELTGGIRAFAQAFMAADGEITSSGFAGVMEWIGGTIRSAFDGGFNAAVAFSDGFLGLNEDVQRSGFNDFFADLGGIFRDIWDFVNNDVLPKLGEGLAWLWEHRDDVAAFAGALAAAFAVMKTAGAIATGVGLLQGAWVAVAGGITLATGALKIFAAHPIIAALMLIAGALVLLWKYSDTFRDGVTKMWDTVKAKFAEFDLGSAWENIKEKAAEAWQTIQDVAGVAWSIVEPIFESIRSVIENDIVPVLSYLWGQWSEIFGKIWGLFERFWDWLEPKFLDLKRLWEEDVVPALQKGAEAIGGVIETVGGIISGVFLNIIGPIFSEIVNFVLNVLGPIFFWLLDHVITPVWNGITSAVSGAWKILGGIFDVIRGVLTGDFTLAWQGLVSMVDGVWTAIWGTIKAIWDDWIWPFLKPVGEKLHDWVVRPFEQAAEQIGKAWASIQEWFRGPINWVITHVINGGVIAFINAIVGALGLDSLKIGNVSTISAPGSSTPSTSGRIRAVEARAKGGYTPPGWTLVGEEGPELVNFTQPGMVYTRGETESLFAAQTSLLGSSISPDLRQDRRYTKDEADYALTALESADPGMLQVAQGRNAGESLLPIGGMLGRFGDWVKDTWSGATEWVTDIGGKAISFVRGKLADAAGVVIKPLQNLVKDNVSGVWGKFFSGAGDKLIDWIRGVDKETEELPVEAEGFAIPGSIPAVAGWNRPLVGGRLTSTFGVSRYGGYHAGIDLAAPTGTPVFAAKPGSVLAAGWNILAGRSGIGVLLAHAAGLGSYYGHLSSAAVSKGQSVNAGSLIGRVGSTGNSTGPHLHWEVSVGGNPQNPINPLGFLSGAGVSAKPKVYDQGGWLMPGESAVNLSAKPEPVFSAEQWEILSRLASVERTPTELILKDVDGKIIEIIRVEVEKSAETSQKWS